MTFTEFHSLLRENFSDIIADAKADAPGTPFIPLAAEYIKDVCLFLRDDARTQCNSLLCLSGVDNADKTLSVVYHIESTTLRHTIALKLTVPMDAPNVPSIERVWKSANWHEREAYDLLGIVFTGHPDLRRILLPDDWEGYPLRKDFKTPEEYNGMKVPY